MPWHGDMGQQHTENTSGHLPEKGPSHDFVADRQVGDSPYPLSPNHTRPFVQQQNLFSPHDVQQTDLSYQLETPDLLEGKSFSGDGSTFFQGNPTVMTSPDDRWSLGSDPRYGSPQNLELDMFPSQGRRTTTRPFTNLGQGLWDRHFLTQGEPTMVNREEMNPLDGLSNPNRLPWPPTNDAGMADDYDPRIVSPTGPTFAPQAEVFSTSQIPPHPDLQYYSYGDPMNEDVGPPFPFDSTAGKLNDKRHSPWLTGSIIHQSQLLIESIIHLLKGELNLAVRRH